MAKTFNKVNPLNSQADEEKPELDQSRGLGEQAMERMIGKIDIPDDERQVAKPINLDMITPDPTQPRREVPAVVRNRAREQGLPEWEMWHQMAERQAGQSIPLKALLRGEGDGPEEEKTGKPLFDGFMALVALAASIYEKGLVNPITVSARSTGYMIETGERRYQAYRLLHGVLGHKKFSRITANVVPHVDVWRQAAENGSRKPLTAIGMARQLALLIMALTGKEYRPYEDFQSDREFYAQVADGTAHRIPSGTAERILQATGLKSKNQLANYRALLDISDALWTLADEEDWTENRIREHVLNLKNPERFTTREPSPSDPLGTQPPMSIKKGEGPGTPATGERMLYQGREVEYVDAQARKGGGLEVLINHIDRNGLRTTSEIVKMTDLQDLPHPERGKNTGVFPSPSAPFVAPKISYDAVGANMATRLEAGQRRQSQAGRIFEILSIMANEVSVVEISPATGKRMSTPFGMHIATLASYPLFDPHAAAREAIMGTDDKPEDTLQAVDNPSSTTADEPPEWAARGKWVIHSLTNTPYKIESTVVDERENRWYFRVRMDGDWGEIPLDECQPYVEEETHPTTPEPRPRHPSLAHMDGVITEAQRNLARIASVAADFGMKDHEAVLRILPVMTPNHLLESLNKIGKDATAEWLAKIFTAGERVLTEAHSTLYTQIAEAHKALEDLESERKRGA